MSVIERKKTDPEMIDDENQEWTDEAFVKAKTLDESSLPESFKRAARRGRPKAERPKVSVTIRFSQEVIEYFKSSGKGWQTRMDQALKEWIKEKTRAS